MQEYDYHSHMYSIMAANLYEASKLLLYSALQVKKPKTIILWRFPNRSDGHHTLWSTSSWWRLKQACHCLYITLEQITNTLNTGGRGGAFMVQYIKQIYKCTIVILSTTPPIYSFVAFWEGGVLWWYFTICLYTASHLTWGCQLDLWTHPGL